MMLSLCISVGLPSSLKELAYIYPPNEVLDADYDTHFYYFFCATTKEPTYVVLVVDEPPFLQQMINNLQATMNARFVYEIEPIGNCSVCL